MKILDIKNNINSRLYIFSYCLLMVISAIYTYSEFNSVNMVAKPEFVSIIWYLGLFTFICIQGFLALQNSLNENFKFKKIMYLLLIFSTLIIILVHVKILTLTMILLFLLILNANFVDYDVFIKYDFMLRIYIFIVLIVVYLCGLFPVAYNAQAVRRGDVVRSSLGFNHPNTFGAYYLYILIALILCVNSRTNISNMRLWKKISLFVFILLSSIYVEVILANSRSAEIALLIIIPLLLVYMIYNFNAPKIWIGFAIVVLTLIIAISLSYYYSASNEIMYKLNVLSSNRLFLQNTALHQYGFGLLGNSMFTQGKPFWIDNQYVFNLLCIGLSGSIVYLWLLFMSFLNAFKGNNYLLYVILIAIVIKSAFESTAVDYYAFLPFIYSFKYFRISKDNR